CAELPSRGPFQELSTDLDSHYAVLVVGAPGAQSVETWDLTTHKRVGRFAPGTTRQRPCAHALLLGDNVLVDTDACKPPGGCFTRAPDRRGRRGPRDAARPEDRRGRRRPPARDAA